MSLINEALKKAQRQRHEETGEAASAAPLPGLETAPATPAGEAAHVRRGKTSGANTLLLIGSGAVVLVVLSVVVTFVLLNRASPSAPATTVATARPAPVAPPPAAARPAVDSPAPPLTPPVIAPAAVTPVPVTPPAPAPAAPAATVPAVPAPPPAPVPAPTAPAVASVPAVPVSPPAPVAAAPAVSTPTLPPPDPKPAAATPAPAAGPAKPDERIARFVEAIKVTGIRSSGAESRVLMNDRVYRVNDTVERTLGVKLTKVEADQLTFMDANGLTYVKGI